MSINSQTSAAGGRPQTGSRGRRGRATALLVTVTVLGASACSRSDDTTIGTPDDVAASAPVESVATDTSIGILPATLSEIGPRSLDADADVMLVIDSVDLTGEDLFVRARVVNAGDQFLNVEDEDDLYGPLLVMTDDDGNTYPARAVEPTGVDVDTIGEMRFRLDGPLDPDAEQIEFEIATTRGRIATEPIAVPADGVALWRTESPRVTFDPPVVTEQDGRIVQVLDVTDRGTHVDVSIEASDADGFTFPADVEAGLTLPDGTRLDGVPVESGAAEHPREFTAVLRFVGVLPDEPGGVRLDVGGLEIELPEGCADDACGDAAADGGTGSSIAVTPRLPDLLHFDVKPTPLPVSIITSTT